MLATDRLNTEQVFHDFQARQRADTFTRRPEEFRFDDDAYLDHETWIRPAFEQLGVVRGRHVLDFGCGHGMAAVLLARRGAWVTAFDLSPGYLAEAGARARANGVSINLVQADGERLPFADRSFDRIWGNAILHHLDLRKTARELLRVLRPGGVAVFCEPWGENPLLSCVRQRLPYPGKQRTPDERPLRQRDIRLLRQVFPIVELRGFQLLSMVRRICLYGELVAALDRLDAWLLNGVPALQRFCRYVVVTARR
jgi:ubiquinone/menaquinone biosynthesis C-methylase UbiE